MSSIKPPSVAELKAERDRLQAESKAEREAAAAAAQAKRDGEIAASKPKLETAAALQKKDFPPVAYVVNTLLAEGCTLFAGRPKVGKSWWVLDAALATASGGTCFGQMAAQGDVLYIALEDNQRRMKRRIAKVFGDGPWPARFEYATTWPRADIGGIDQIKAWIKSKPNPRLIVIDVLAAFRPGRVAGAAAYDGDYAAIKALQEVAAATPGLSVVVVHHLRKGASESGDPIDLISGTLGLAGAADSLLIINKDSQGTILYGRGRDTEELELSMQFDSATCRWQVLGEAADVRMTDIKAKIMEAVRSSPTPITPKDIADVTGIEAKKVRTYVGRLAKDGHIRWNPGGKYNVAPALPPLSNPIVLPTTPMPKLPPGYIQLPDGTISAPPG